MPTLNWIGKEKVVKHHLDVPFRILEPSYTYGDQEEATQNKVIHGDNLEALKSLLPEYEGKIKCIYIDPPYNTGNEGWVYNDNVNHPKIRKWLGEVVGKEGEDLSRHDKWLCMMYPRLKLLHRLLSDDGAIFVSIDDTEVATLRLIMDEIFGMSNFLATINWQKKQSPQNDAVNFSDMHDFIVTYAKKKNSSRNEESGWNRNLLPKTEQQNSRYKNPDNDPRGPWTSGDCTSNKTKYERPNLFYGVLNPITNEKIWPSEQRVWRYEQKTFESLVEDNRIWWGKNGRNFPRLKKFANEGNEGIVPGTWWNRDFAGDNQLARRVFRSIIDDVDLDFQTPKPPTLVEKIIQIGAKKNDIILDSFAGSGTTAHAVLNLNKEDGGNRKFILVELEDYADSITAERVKRVMDGYGSNGKEVEGTGGGFTFYELGKPLFLSEGSVNKDVPIDKLREYIYFTETKKQLPEAHPENTYFLGSERGNSYYLLHEHEKPMSLDYVFLSTLVKKDEAYIIYADRCLIDEELMRKHNIIFKKVPRDIVRF